MGSTIIGTPADAPAPVTVISATGNSLAELGHRLQGSIPKIPIDLCYLIINDAYRDIRRQNLWSFQLFESNWSSPSFINSGTASVTQGSNTVVLDATAAAAVIAAGSLPTPITQRQFRSGIGTIYNIWDWDADTTLTLDRAYAEATNASATYSIYQCYYPAPYADFLTWISVRDMGNFLDLFVHRKNREQLDADDPQRTWYYFPTDVVYYKQDHNPDSPTYLYPMFELWGHPQARFTWQCYGIRKGAELVQPSDMIPNQIGVDCVLAKARQYAYEWAEANKGDMPRNQGSDFKFLIGAAKAEYEKLFKEYRRQDRETCNNWLSVRRTSMYGKVFAYYSSLSGTAYPGIPF